MAACGTPVRRLPTRLTLCQVLLLANNHAFAQVALNAVELRQFRQFRSWRSGELVLLGGVFERLHGGFAANAANPVEVTGADEGLVFGGVVAMGFGGEFLFLQLGVSRHLSLAVSLRKLPHAVVNGVETGQGYELE